MYLAAIDALERSRDFHRSTADQLRHRIEVAVRADRSDAFPSDIAKEFAVPQLRN
jgi:hypothetical protein